MVAMHGVALVAGCDMWFGSLVTASERTQKAGYARRVKEERKAKDPNSAQDVIEEDDSDDDLQTPTDPLNTTTFLLQPFSEPGTAGPASPKVEHRGSSSPELLPWQDSRGTPAAPAPNPMLAPTVDAHLQPVVGPSRASAAPTTSSAASRVPAPAARSTSERTLDVLSSFQLSGLNAEGSGAVQMTPSGSGTKGKAKAKEKAKVKGPSKKR